MIAPQPIHATCISINGHGVLIIGASGSGKSDLALRLIDRGARLVSDDYTNVKAENGKLIASPPETIAGKIEVRGVGIVEIPYAPSTLVSLIVDLEGVIDRFPDPKDEREIMGVRLATLSLAAHEASTPIKIEWAIRQQGAT
jgi:serine kinase of HPr protein (carbohydrate metabolism regulator)